MATIIYLIFRGVRGQVLKYYKFGTPVLTFGYGEKMLIQNLILSLFSFQLMVYLDSCAILYDSRHAGFADQ